MNRLLQLLDGKNIAIVGNGNVKEDHSNEIDSADIVIRFNHFYNYDSNLVGKKVDIILQTITDVWYKAENKHIDVILEQKPQIFIIKRRVLYDSNAHSIYGNKIRVDKALALELIEWTRFTTGTCSLIYLAKNLKNARVRCYGFQDEEDWERYIRTDGCKYAIIKDQERKEMLNSIETLEQLEITHPHKDIPKTVVIPIKRHSDGAKDKNRLLIRHCINEALKCNLPINVVGNDTELFSELNEEYNGAITTCEIEIDSDTSDVTDTLRKWKEKTNYCGDIALVQCTSPFLKHEWIFKCFDELKYAPISATAVENRFKPTALFKLENNVYVPYNENEPSASVARQLLPHTIRITGAVEAFHSDSLVFDSFFQGGVLRPVMVEESESLDVDTDEELNKALEIINKD